MHDLTGGSLRISTDEFFGAAFLGNFFVSRKVRKLPRKAAQTILFEHPQI
jgi:hypothetical protein